MLELPDFPFLGNNKCLSSSQAKKKKKKSLCFGPTLMLIQLCVSTRKKTHLKLTSLHISHSGYLRPISQEYHFEA